MMLESTDTILEQKTQNALSNRSEVLALFQYIWINGINLPYHQLERSAALVKAKYADDQEIQALIGLSLGMGFLFQSQFDQALETLLNAKTIYEALNNEEGLGAIYTNLGMVYRSLGSVEMGLENLKFAYGKVKHSVDFERFYVIAVYQIAEIYTLQGKNEKAEKKYLELINFKEGELKDRALSGLGNLYLEIGRREEGYEILHNCLENLGNNRGGFQLKSRILHDLGLHYLKIGDFVQAESNLLKSKNIRIENKIFDALFSSYLALSKLYNALDDLKLEFRYLSEALELTEIISLNFKYIELHKLLSEYYEQHQDFENALAHFKKFQQYESELNKIQKEKEILNIKKIHQIESSQREHEIIKAKNLELAGKNAMLETYNKEIKDSITYAKRIQKAILPPQRLLDELLPENFVLYLPKDIVAGDFYWLEKKGNSVYFAACDCTGHGVPGALVSLICNNALNRSLNEFGRKKPGEILDQTRQIVISEFEKSEENVSDGMDVALCKIENNILSYAGANNPLWLIRNNELIEIKGDKQPIGNFHNPVAFTTHDLELEKGDTIYIFTDGYSDQFGGEKGKKFRSKTLGDLLLQNQALNLEDQQLLLKNKFEDWKGDQEQVDDVCVIGVRIR